jgi:hypothetical protein
MKPAEVAEKGGKQIKRPSENLKPQGRVQYNSRHALDVYNAASRSPSTEVLDDQLKYPVRPAEYLLENTSIAFLP